VTGVFAGIVVLPGLVLSWDPAVSGQAATVVAASGLKVEDPGAVALDFLKETIRFVLTISSALIAAAFAILVREEGAQVRKGLMGTILVVASAIAAICAQGSVYLLLFEIQAQISVAEISFNAPAVTYHFQVQLFSLFASVALILLALVRTVVYSWLEGGK
jgi:hypothetical protein